MLKSNTESLGERLKGYEKQFEGNVGTKEHMVVRIDGHKFSKFTKGFKKPFDKVLSQSMVETTKDLVKHFGASIGYTQSDEISLVFPASFKQNLKPVTDAKDITDGVLAVSKEDGSESYVFTEYECDERYPITKFFVGDEYVEMQERRSGAYGKDVKPIFDKREELFEDYDFFIESLVNNQIFGGRVQKITSLVASYTTMRFNFHLSNLINKEVKENGESIQEFIEYKTLIQSKVGNAMFDARVYGVEDREECLNSIIWRIRDAEKNSRSMFAQTFCSHKSLLNKTGLEQVEFCLETTGKDWNVIEDKFKYGILVKKETFEQEIEPDYAKFHEEGSTVLRNRIVEFYEKLSFSEENIALVMNKTR